MNIELYYFTGTGNSLAIAQDLAHELKGSVLFPMAASGKIRTDAEIIGLIFPVYFLDVPRFVKEFVQEMQIGNPSGYIFAVTNCGGDAGNTLFNLDQTLREKAHKLSAGFVLKMPDNSLFFETSPEERNEEFVMEKSTVKQIAEWVSARETSHADFQFKTFYRLLGKTIAWGFRSVINTNKKVCIAEQCNRCGQCRKICPVGNITINDGRVIWGSSCQECFACIHRCPQQAIRFGRLRMNKKKVYHHPEVSFQEIEMQKNRYIEEEQSWRDI